MMNIAFSAIFHKLTENNPFPWQESLYKKFIRGEIPPAADLPTGLGKTSVVAIWLVALITHPGKVPRRLVYVVNRRTVVDQTTVEVCRIRKRLEKFPEWRDALAKLCAIPADNPLAISTLRGQFADNREWCADPARPAVIVGTVDMIGSRLLFSGYGAGLKTKPLHAGFLGQDVLLIHDEAHLEPAFQKLLMAIKREQEQSNEFREFHVMALSATSRQEPAEQSSFGLTPEEKFPPSDLPDPPTEPLHVVWQRLKAKKGLKFQPPVKRSEVAEQIARLALLQKSSGKAVLIFVRTIDDVNRVRELLTNKKEGVPENQVQVLTGTVRGWERARLVKDDPEKGDPIFRRFLLKTSTNNRTVYLVCTSAGEVGIDISGDCMVSDLTSLDSMTQRLGRVNRRGEGAAEIDVVYESDADPKLTDDGWEKARWKTLEILQRLPQCDWIERRHDASPLALRELNLSDEERKAAFAPEPTCLPTTDILFDAWAMTSIRDALPGRPPVAPYLHGISEWQPPETRVAWREEVDVIKDELLERYKPEDLLDDYPLKPQELLRDSTDRKGSGVFAQLEKLAANFPDAQVWILDAREKVLPITLKEMIEQGPEQLRDATVILPPKIGGLSRAGTLDGKAKPDLPVQHDVSDLWFVDIEQTQLHRVRVWNDDPEFTAKTKGMRLIRAPLDTDPAADDRESGETSERRFWHWFTRPRSADDDSSETSTAPVEWQKHTDEVVEHTQKIVQTLNLSEDFQKALVLAAKFHDLGKRREVWQRRIGNPKPEVWYAKSGRDPAWKPRDICRDYRHEFGSLRDAELEDELKKLGADEHDLVLHLIAAHHGRARPHFPKEEAFDPVGSTPADSEAIAIEVPRRFARLQRRFGRWGLAYLESLLRAADYAASAGISPNQQNTP